jgi:hypothetical protein
MLKSPELDSSICASDPRPCMHVWRRRYLGGMAGGTSLSTTSDRLKAVREQTRPSPEDIFAIETPSSSLPLRHLLSNPASNVSYHITSVRELAGPHLRLRHSADRGIPHRMLQRRPGPACRPLSLPTCTPRGGPVWPSPLSFAGLT